MADCCRKEDGGRVGWVMNSLGVGAQALGSGIGRRMVIEEYLCSEGNVVNDDRSDLKTKNLKMRSGRQRQASS